MLCSDWSIWSYDVEYCVLIGQFIVRPQTQGEEELQLQLALAMSREEAEAEDSKKKSDDMRLQMAIAKSKEDNSDKVGSYSADNHMTTEL